MMNDRPQAGFLLQATGMSDTFGRAFTRQLDPRQLGSMLRQVKTLTCATILPSVCCAAGTLAS